jgi:hypothetical protein
MQLHCPVCSSNKTSDFFAVTAAGMAPECLNAGTFEHVPADCNVVQALYGPQFDGPMVIQRCNFPPRPRLTSFWSLVCFIYPAGAVLGTLDLLFTGEYALLPVMIGPLLVGAIIGAIPFLRRKVWDRKWTDRHRYLTRVASCQQCNHAWRP